MLTWEFIMQYWIASQRTALGLPKVLFFPITNTEKVLPFALPLYLLPLWKQDGSPQGTQQSRDRAPCNSSAHLHSLSKHQTHSGFMLALVNPVNGDNPICIVLFHYLIINVSFHNRNRSLSIPLLFHYLWNTSLKALNYIYIVHTALLLVYFMT